MLESILDTIGNTPLVALRKIPFSAGTSESRIYVKLELFNPTGSLKDRIYKKMILEAVRSGQLHDGMEILEASTGNGGIACSYIGRLLGYRVTVVMPEGMSEERRKLIKAYGGEVLFTPGGESDVDLCLERIEEMMKQNSKKYWFPDQFSNPNNPLAHYETTGPEIFNQTSGNVECFLASQGSGGALTGVGRYLRESKGEKVKLYAVEPAEAPILSEGRWGSHRIEGIGDGFVPRNLDISLLHGVVTVSSIEAIEMTRRLMREEGVFCGISSGCNVAAAIKVAKRHSGLTIATLVNDSGNRYLSTEVFASEKKKEPPFSTPKREHDLDEHSREQLELLRQKKFEIIN